MSNERKFKLIPQPEMVILEEVKVKEVTDGGIVLSDEAKASQQRKQNRGTIIWVGSKVDWLKEGDFVSFYKNAATQLTIEGEEFSEVHEAHVLCVMEGVVNKN